MPTRLDFEEAEVISIDSESDNDYVPPEPVYEPGSPRPEPVEEAPEDPRSGPSGEKEPSRVDPGGPNIFTDSARGREDGPGASNDFNESVRPRVRGRGRGIPGAPVQHVAHFFRGTRNRRNFLGRVRPM